MTNLYSLQKKPENLGLTDVFINFREIFEKCQFLYILVERWNEIPYAEIVFDKSAYEAFIYVHD